AYEGLEIERVARGVGSATQVHVVEALAAQAQVPVRLEEIDPLLELLDGLAVLHAGLAVLLHPGRFLLDLVLGLLQLAADFLHHLAAELLLIENGRRLRHVGRRGRPSSLARPGRRAPFAGLRRRRRLRGVRGWILRRLLRRLRLALRRRDLGRSGRSDEADGGGECERTD